MALRVSTPAVSPEKVLVNNWNLPASGVVYVRADCNKLTPATSLADYRVKMNKAHSITYYRSMGIANIGTITLAAATRVDDGDTFFLNGVALTAETTSGEAVGTKWLSGLASATLDAASLAACINANIPGVTATAAAEVITVVPSGTAPAPTLLFQLAANGAGTQAADAAEIAWADGTLANLTYDSNNPPVTGLADNSTTSGFVHSQYVDGYPYAYVAITDTSAAISALTVGSILHDSL